MNLDVFLNKKANLASENRLLKFVVLVIGVAVFVSVIGSYYVLQHQKVIIIPPGVRTKIVVSGNIVNEEYIKAFTRYISSLAFSYNPATARKQYDELLALYDPRSYPLAKTSFYNLADKIEMTKVSSAFYIDKIWVDEQKKRIEVLGRHQQYMDDRRVEDETKTYLIGYKISHGRFTVTSISTLSRKSKVKGAANET